MEGEGGKIVRPHCESPRKEQRNREMVNNQKRGMLKDEDFGASITFGHPCPSGSCPRRLKMCDTHWHLLACVCR